MERPRTFKLDKLYHQFLRPAQLGRGNIENLANQLQVHGYIKRVGEDRYYELDKMTNRDDPKRIYKILTKLTEGALMTSLTISVLTCLLLASGLVGCASQPEIHQPYTYNGSLSELHRAGNPNTRPAVPRSSGDLRTPDRLVSRTCTSIPIFDLYGQFVRYHVECR